MNVIKKLKRDLKKVHNILTISIINMVFLIAWIVIIIINVINISSSIDEITNTSIIIEEKSSIESKIVFLSLLNIIFIVMFCIYFIFNFVNFVIIISYNWKIEEMHDSKLLWGVLTIILLGPIASLIFSIIWSSRIKLCKLELENNSSEKN